MKESTTFQGPIASPPGIIRQVRQQSQKEIAADNLAQKLKELDLLEERKAEFNEQYKKQKEALQTEVRNISAIIRNYTPVFEQVNTETGEIKE